MNYYQSEIRNKLYSKIYLADYQLDRIQKLKFIIKDGQMNIIYSKNFDFDFEYELLSIPEDILVIWIK